MTENEYTAPTVCKEMMRAQTTSYPRDVNPESAKPRSQNAALPEQ